MTHGYIDVHSHLLPDVDDGSDRLATTEQMLRLAYEEGIRVILATPHHHPRRGHKDANFIRQVYGTVQPLAARAGIRLLLGSEIYFSETTVSELAAGRLLTMNDSRCVLIEFDPESAVLYIEQSIQQLQNAGYEILLAHVERYRNLMKHPEEMAHLYNMGVHLQLNADSITRSGGWKTKRSIHRLLYNHMIFCVGTDAHDLQTRAPKMDRAAAIVAKRYGEDYMRELFTGNAKKLMGIE